MFRINSRVKIRYREDVQQASESPDLEEMSLIKLLPFIRNYHCRISGSDLLQESVLAVVVVVVEVAAVRVASAK